MKRIDAPDEIIRSYLSYDPATGIFVWIKRPGPSSACGTRAGRVDHIGYVQINFRRVQYRGHKLAWWFVTGEWPNGYIDHKNLDKSDNRFANLRLASPSTNNANSPKRSGCSSRFKGVTRTRSGSWQANIGVNRKRKHLGTFRSEEEASAAYMAAAVAAFGEFARAE